ncbi:alpha/beta fold hydrolase [Parafrankia sp. BMG5.11]|uniref:alpha/beta fold hydrolase n=1 Tax=Parafrankia sp. BMG5.11 TaxID=222540 RepID=UPI00103A96B1|nr:alpha/beta hydrolase [Parafrankia sp. BMG5.11]TCJ31881.1 alpha/beta hydrolase [Parafrankia sp. BMG5.11]
MTTPATAVVDVTGRVPIDGRHHVTTWVFPPTAGTAGPVPLLFCLPGGSYTKAYWHLEVPGRTGYSFGEHMAGHGMLVIAVDHIGTGESSRHPRAAELTPDVVAAANAATLAELTERAVKGSLLPDLGPLELGPTVGVGHSMGAMLAIFQQSLHGSFDAVAPLGYGTVGPIITWADTHASIGTGVLGVPSLEAIMEPARSGAFDTPFAADRTMTAMRHHFYWDDVPADVIATDDLTNTHLPGVSGPLSIVPFIASDHAGRLRCPVFIGLGERDSTPRHHDEARAYYSSLDVTLFVLPKSGHCHNAAGTRRLLWDRLARWIRALPPTSSTDGSLGTQP